LQILERALRATRHINDNAAPAAAFRFRSALSEKQSPLVAFGRKLMHVFEFFCAATEGSPHVQTHRAPQPFGFHEPSEKIEQLFVQGGSGNKNPAWRPDFSSRFDG
jgi:hypothetical protein